MHCCDKKRNGGRGGWGGCESDFNKQHSDDYYNTPTTAPPGHSNGTLHHQHINIRTLPKPWGRPCASRSPSYVSRIGPSVAADKSIKGADAANAVHAASVLIRATLGTAATTDANCPRPNTAGRRAEEEKHFIRDRVEAEKHFIRDRVAWRVVRNAR